MTIPPVQWAGLNVREWLSARLHASFWNITPTHSLFVMRFQPLPPIRHRPEWLNSLLVTVIGTLSVVVLVAFPVSFILVSVLLVFGLLCVPFGGVLRGLVLAGESGRGIAMEGRDPARMALFHLMPHGQLGTAWVLSVRAIRLSRRFRLFSLAIKLTQWMGAGLLVFVILLVVMTLPISLLSGDSLWLLSYLMGGSGLLVAWTLVLNRQAPVLGLVCGLWGSTVGAQSWVAWLAAVGAYLGAIGLIFVVELMILSSFNGLVGSYTDDRLLGVLFFIGVIFWMINSWCYEMAIRVMWAWVCRRMNASGDEIEVKLRVG